MEPATFAPLPLFFHGDLLFCRLDWFSSFGGTRIGAKLHQHLWLFSWMVSLWWHLLLTIDLNFLFSCFHDDCIAFRCAPSIAMHGFVATLITFFGCPSSVVRSAVVATCCRVCLCLYCLFFVVVNVVGMGDALPLLCHFMFFFIWKERLICLSCIRGCCYWLMIYPTITRTMFSFCCPPFWCPSGRYNFWKERIVCLSDAISIIINVSPWNKVWGFDLPVIFIVKFVSLWNELRLLTSNLEFCGLGICYRGFCCYWKCC